MRIWIDADSCPVKIREIAVKASTRTGLPLVMVANRLIPHPESELVNDVVVGAGEDEADNYILDNAEEHDIVITRDIPFAERLIRKNLNVINDRGVIYTEENIRERLSVRNMMLEIRKSGLKINEDSVLSHRDIRNFSNSFDKLLTKLIKIYNNL